MRLFVICFSILVSAFTAFASTGVFDCDVNKWSIEKCNSEGKSFVSICIKRSTGDFEEVATERNFLCKDGEVYPLSEVAADLIRRSELRETKMNAISFPKTIVLLNADIGTKTIYSVKDVISNGSF
ncbi:MAG: hypothetical protein WA160_12345 [Pseudobdellovibrio sp.]